MRRYNQDQQFGDLKFRTRLRYYDEKILSRCLDRTADVYRVPKNANVVVDVGGNIGSISCLAAQLGAKKVISFEPCLDNYETLKYNVELNGFKDIIECVKKGVGTPNKETKLFIHPRNSGATSSKNYNTGLSEDNFEIVEFISIQDVFKDYNIDHCDMLKLDCEGGEEDIIRDLDEELINKIDQISLEFHNRDSIRELTTKLSKYYNMERTGKYEYVFKKKYNLMKELRVKLFQDNEYLGDLVILEDNIGGGLNGGISFNPKNDTKVYYKEIPLFDKFELKR
jgi:FkbM family methyltransferase